MLSLVIPTKSLPAIQSMRSKLILYKVFFPFFFLFFFLSKILSFPKWYSSYFVTSPEGLRERFTENMMFQSQFS